MAELPWIAEARKHIGLREVPGPLTNTTIKRWLLDLKAWWSDDATPWCGVFAAHCLQAAKLPYPKDYYRALAYANMPVKLSRPAYGCIVVFRREGGGHVGFVVGQDLAGHLMVLGGNQGDKVCIKPFDRNRVTAYLWPSIYPGDDRFNLPTLRSDGKVSTNEA